MVADLEDIADSFRRDGFVLVEGFFSPGEVETMQRELARYIDQVVPRLESRYVFHEAGDNGPIKHLTSPELHDDFFKRIREGYHQIKDQNPNRCVEINADQSKECVFRDIRETLMDKFEEVFICS